MKRRKTYIFILCILTIPVFLFFGCRDHIDDEMVSKKEAKTGSRENNIIEEMTYDSSDCEIIKWAIVDAGVEVRNDIERKLNNELIKQGYDIQVVFVPCEVPEGKNVYDQFMSQTKGDVDLLTIRNYSAPNPGISYPVEYAAYEYPVVQFVKNEMLLPLDDYMDGALGDIVADQQDLICCKYHNVIYGLPCNKHITQCRAYRVDKELFDKSDLTFQDMAKEWWELEDAFETLYNANGRKPILYYESGLPFSTDNFKQYDVISALLAISDDTVLKIYEQENVQKTLEAWKRYIEKGYVSRNYEEELISNVFSDHGNKVVVETISDSSLTVDSYIIPYGNINASRYTDMFSPGICICSKSKKIEKAMEFLNAIEKNEELRKILSYGIEGIDYDEKDGIIYRKNDSEFFGGLSIYGEKVSGQQFSEGTLINVLITDISEDRYSEGDLTTAAIGDNQCKYKDLTFDLSQYADEMEEMNTLYQSFKNNFSMNRDVREQLDEFNRNVRRSGINRVIQYISNRMEEVNEK